MLKRYLKKFTNKFSKNLFFKAYAARIRFDVENAVNFMTIMHGQNLSTNARYTLLPVLFTLHATTFMLGLTRLVYACTLGLITHAIALGVETKMKAEFAMRQLSSDDTLQYQQLKDMFLVIDRHTHTADPLVLLDHLNEFSKLTSTRAADISVEGEHTVRTAIETIQNNLFNKTYHPFTASPYWNRVKYNFSKPINLLKSLYNANKEISSEHKYFLAPFMLTGALTAVAVALSSLLYHATIGWMTTYISLQIEKAAYVEYAMEKKGIRENSDDYRALYESLYDIIDVEHHTTDIKVIGAALAKLADVELPNNQGKLGDVKLDEATQPESLKRLCSRTNVARLKQSFFAEQAKVTNDMPLEATSNLVMA